MCNKMRNKKYKIVIKTARCIATNYFGERCGCKNVERIPYVLDSIFTTNTHLINRKVIFLQDHKKKV